MRVLGILAPTTEVVGPIVGYTVYVDGVPRATTSALTYDVTGLSPSTEYVFNVQGFDAFGAATDLSDSIHVTTLANSVPIPSSIPLQSLVANAAYLLDLLLYVSDADADPLTFSVVSGLLPTGIVFNVDRFQGTPTVPGEVSTITMRVADPYSSADFTVNFSIYVADTTAPPTPTGLAVTPVSSSQLNLSWNASVDVAGVEGELVTGTQDYRVYRSTDGTNFSLRATVTAVSYSDTGLSGSTQYWYKVTARDTVPNESAQSTAVSATTPSAGSLAADWIARSTASGVTFATDFSTVADVTNWIFPNSGASRVTRYTGDSVTNGPACLRIDTFAATDSNNSAWVHPLDSSWTTDQQGFGAGYWCMQVAVKLPASRLASGSNGGGFKLFNIGECRPQAFNLSRSHPNGEIVLTSYATYDLIPWLYRDIDFSQDPLSEAFGTGGDLYMQPYRDTGSDQTQDNRYCLWHGATGQITAGCLRWPTDQWFHLLLEVRIVGAGNGNAHANNRIALSIQLPGETKYTKLWDSRGITIGADPALPLGNNGLHLLQFDTGRTSGTQDTYALYGSVIISREFILPAGIATPPQWFSDLTDATWTAKANAGSARLSQVVPVPNPIWPSLGGAPSDLPANWCSSAVNPEQGEYIFCSHGGHSSWAGNETYVLNLRAATPAWKRISDPTPVTAGSPWVPNPPSTGATWPAAYKGRWLDGRPTSTHCSGEVYGNWRVFFPISNSYSNEAGDSDNLFYAYDLRDPAIVAARAANTPLAWTSANIGPWEWYGPHAGVTSGELNHLTFGVSFYDPYTQKAWYFGGKGEFAPIAIAIDTAFKGDGPPPVTIYRWPAVGVAGGFRTWVACAYDLRIGILGNAFDQTIYTFSLDNPSAGLTLVSNTTGTGYWGIFQEFIQYSYAGGIYSRENNSVLVGDPFNIGQTIYRLQIPTSGSGFNKTYNASGQWAWTSSVPTGTGPASVPGGNTYARWNKMDMGNGRNAIVVCSDINAVHVYKIPQGGTVATYSTTFSATENPISEGGGWSKTDNNCTAVRTSGGIAFGTITGTGGYNDSAAYRTGLGNNLEASCIIAVDPAINTSLNHEMELLFRNTSTSTTTQQYEVLLNRGGGLQFMKWLGGHAFDQFQDLGFTSGPGSLGRPPVSGEKFIARCETIGSSVRLTAWILQAGQTVPTLIGQTTDSSSPYLTGKCGIGFYISDAAANSAHFAMTSYDVTQV